jgi:GntR family transcriptional regulator
VNAPLYRSVYNTIVQRIAVGDLAPGSMLPSEIDLGKELGVSQGTARKALIELELKGIVQRRQGRGTFVTLRTPENSLFHFFRLRNENEEQVIPKLESESVKRRKATADEKNQLFAHPDTVFEISRIRSANGTTLCLEKSVVPAPLFPGLLERLPLPNTLYVLFQLSYSCVIISAQENLKAGFLGAENAKKANMDPMTPVIIAKRRAYDVLDRVVELRTTMMITNAATYFVELD